MRDFDCLVQEDGSAAAGAAAVQKAERRRAKKARQKAAAAAAASGRPGDAEDTQGVSIASPATTLDAANTAEAAWGHSREPETMADIPDAGLVDFTSAASDWSGTETSEWQLCALTKVTTAFHSSAASRCCAPRDNLWGA